MLFPLSYVEIDGKDIAFTIIDSLEELSNYTIGANLAVKNNDGHIFIDGLSNIPYEGPCLFRTGEVSLLKISNIEKIDSKIRLNILCGNRAYMDYRKKSNTLNNIMNYLNVTEEEELFKFIKKIKSNVNIKEVPAKISEKKSEEPKELKENNSIEEKETTIEEKETTIEEKETTIEEKKTTIENSTINLVAEDANKLKNIATNVDGINYIYKVIRNISYNRLKEAAQKIMKEKDYIQVYGIPNGEKSQFLILRSQNLNISLKDISNNLEKKYVNMKATGNLYIIQGICDTNSLASIMEGFLLESKKHFETKNNICWK